jgi:glyceraldehyde 3-phosphate dehydrogenase
MTVRVGINGFGRIGRDILRASATRPDPEIEIVAVNDLVAPETMARLLRHDSTYGPWRADITVAHDELVIDGHRIHATGEHDPGKLRWGALGVDIVIESSGQFRSRDQAAAHRGAGAGKVVISAPGRGVDATFVVGVNDGDYDPEIHHIVSNASCTTNCVAPMLFVLHRAFEVRYGLLTTIHSYTNDQALLDSPHNDPRRARSAAVNIIPTSTGAAREVGEVIPELAGRLDGIDVRVPVEDGSLADLAVVLSEPATVGQVNRAFADAASSHLKDILRYTDEPLGSRDVIGDPASCVFDASLTRATPGMVKVFGWHDNEWGYANRTIELAEKIARQL